MSDPMQQSIKSCPVCGEGAQLKRQNFGLLKMLSLGFLRDIGSLLVAILLFAAISALSFTGAYGIGIIVIFGGGFYFHAKSRDYTCAKCDRVFSKHELDTV